MKEDHDGGEGNSGGVGCLKETDQDVGEQPTVLHVGMAANHLPICRELQPPLSHPPAQTCSRPSFPHFPHGVSSILPLTVSQMHLPPALQGRGNQGSVGLSPLGRMIQCCSQGSDL